MLSTSRAVNSPSCARHGRCRFSDVPSSKTTMFLARLGGGQLRCSVRASGSSDTIGCLEAEPCVGGAPAPALAMPCKVSAPAPEDVSAEQRVHEVVLKQAARAAAKPRTARTTATLPAVGGMEAAFHRCGEVCKEYAKTFYLATQLMTPERRRAIWAIYEVKHKERLRGFRDVADKYLTEEQYLEVSVAWLDTRPDAYRALCARWASQGFQDVSKTRRECRGTDGKHHLGGDGFVRLAKRMERETGREPAPMEVWVRGHLGSDPSQPDQLSSQKSTQHVAKYREEVQKLRGEGYDWLGAPVVLEAVYESGGGKPHGRLGVLDGAVDSRRARACSSASSSQYAGSSSSHTSRDVELQSVREELQRTQEALRSRDEALRTRDEMQAAALRARDEYQTSFMLQWQSAMQAIAAGQPAVFPQWAPPPMEMPPMPTTGAEGSRTHAQTPSPQTPAFGQGREDDFLNSDGSGRGSGGF